MGELRELVAAAKRRDRQIAAIFVESVQSCGGQIVYPHHWMRDAFEFCKQEGIVTIADEVLQQDTGLMVDLFRSWSIFVTV